MLVTAIQMEIRDGEMDWNLAHALDLLRDAPKSDMYLLPELFTTGYAHRTWEQAADAHTSVVLAKLGEVAKARGAMIIAGTVARNTRGKLVNRLWEVDGTGEPQHYDKIHLIAAFKEPELLERGNAPCLREIQGLKSHFSLCFDLRFPELYRCGALDGAETFFIISEWPAKRAELMVALARARAIENQAFVVLCNRTGMAKDRTEFDGRSQIIGPEGEAIAVLADGEGYCTGNVDGARVRDLRERFPVLEWSRRTW